MKVIFPLLVFLFLGLITNAQDRIYFKEGKITEAKILEINKDEVVFKRMDNPDGPTYHELKRTIQKIVYANGLIDTFPTYNKEEIPKVEIKTPEQYKPETQVTIPLFSYKKNLLTYSFSDILFKRATFAYERIIANGHLGFKIPLTVGFGSNAVFDVDYLNNFNGNSSTNYYNGITIPSNSVKYTSILRKCTIGLEANIYPFGQHPVSFFVGPAFYYGWIDYKAEETSYIPLYNPSNPYYGGYSTTVTPRKGSGTSFTGMLNAGWVFKANADYCLTMALGLGFRQNNTIFDDFTTTIFNPSFQLGYTF